MERALCLVALIISFGSSSALAQVNSWVLPTSGNWDEPTNWSLNVRPNNSQSVMITNSGFKSVAINPSTPINFSNSMTVSAVTIGGATNTGNALLLNFFGTTPPLHVLNDLDLGPNGHLTMLYSGLTVDNLLHVKAPFDQEGGQLTFTNSSANTMQIDGGRFNLTNGVVTGNNLYVSGTNGGNVTHVGGVVTLDSLILGWNGLSANTNNGTYTLQSGWLMVGVSESVGQSGMGTLVQNGGTNSTSDLLVGYGNYFKNGGALFAGQLRVMAPGVSILAPPNATVTHSGGGVTITNDLLLEGQGNRHAPQFATFNMSGGSLSAHRIVMQNAGLFFHTNGSVNIADELFVDDVSGLPSNYSLSGGTLSTSNATISSSYPESSYISQTGGTDKVANTLSINGTAIYQLNGGTVNVPNILLTGFISLPPQFFVVGAPSFAITNESITLNGGAVVIQDSTQQFGRLTMTSDSGINLAGAAAILRFADSHTNIWQGNAEEPPRLWVYNWRGSTNGGGATQLSFGNNSSALTASQLTQIQFVNPTGFPPGTNSARILSTGEVVPMLTPTITWQNNVTNLTLNWSGNFILQSATNVLGPYFDVTNAVSPYSVNAKQFPMQFFRLRN